MPGSKRTMEGCRVKGRGEGVWSFTETTRWHATIEGTGPDEGWKVQFSSKANPTAASVWKADRGRAGSAPGEDFIRVDISF